MCSDISFVKWDAIAQAKELGGLGLRSFHVLNRAFLV